MSSSVFGKIESGSTGVPAVDTIVVWCVAGTALAGILVMLWRLVRGMRRVVMRVDDFVDDWQEVGSRPGVAARPAVMARLDAIESRLTSVEHEVRPNSGSSLRDAVDRVDRRTAQLTED
ncbi:hypothetical protein E4U91_36485 [Streptomyces lasalocidi]|uniref:DUF2746 domain-containing protein n=2 Tax=Streptomyces TaxID=1883 RepID=A0A4U5W5C9_STRLS|nr:hypothetical protein E4U91_36485 [Streptomyces lasalocidi]